MKGLAITNPGIEDITASEIKEITSAKAEKRKGCVVFEANDFEDFFRICYSAQSVRKVLLLLAEFKINNIDDIKKEIDKIDIDGWINENSTFVARSLITDNDIDKQEVEAKTGEFILDKVNAKVELKNPDTTFFVFIEGNNCYLGIDFSGSDLGKRDYRIFTGGEPMKPTVAYALLRIADFKAEDALLDPFCRSGTIPIEAALFATKTHVNFYSKDKFLFMNLEKFKRFDFEDFFEKEDSRINKKQKTSITAADASFQAVTAAKKNAKIAGVQKNINFSRKEPEWLDTKFKEHTVDRIVSFPPQKSKTKNPKQIEKTYDQLFYQADYILKKDGVVVLLMKDVETAENAAEKHGFAVKEKRKIMQGKEEYSALSFTKAL